MRIEFLSYGRAPEVTARFSCKLVFHPWHAMIRLFGDVAKVLGALGRKSDAAAVVRLAAKLHASVLARASGFHAGRPSRRLKFAS